MSEQDKWDVQAAELLPCCWTCSQSRIRFGADRNEHEGGCPASLRPAVAAALRAQGAELDKLRAVFASVAPTNSKAYGGLLGTGQALIDKDAEIAQLRAQLAEAEKRGIEKAIELISTSWLDPLLSGKDKVVFNSPCPDIERLLTALRDRIRAAMAEAEGER